MTNEEAAELLKRFQSGLDPLSEFELMSALSIAIAALRNQPEWIPFESREAEKDEKGVYPEWDSYRVLCGKLPDDGQRILVNVKCKGHEAVQMDEFYTYSDCCYLDSGYEIETEATAWMPLPPAYKGGENNG